MLSITYDANGAMYAVEMTAYPHPEQADEMALGQVWFLLDDEANGKCCGTENRLDYCCRLLDRFK